MTNSIITRVGDRFKLERNGEEPQDGAYTIQELKITVSVCNGFIVSPIYFINSLMIRLPNSGNTHQVTAVKQKTDRTFHCDHNLPVAPPLAHPLAHPLAPRSNLYQPSDDITRSFGGGLRRRHRSTKKSNRKKRSSGKKRRARKGSCRNKRKSRSCRRSKRCSWTKASRRSKGHCRRSKNRR